jgi:serine/threonine-protein kinase
LEESQAEAHLALAWLELNDWDFAGAEREFKRAIELNPNLVAARIWYISYLSAMRRVEEVDAQIAIALQLEPASVEVLMHVVPPYLSFGRVDKGIELCQKALDLDPNYFYIYAVLGKAYYLKGMYAEAASAYEKAIQLAGRGNVGAMGGLAAAYIKAGRRKEGLALVREAEKRPPGSGRGLPLPYFVLGRKDVAFAELAATVERRGPYMAFLLAEPLWEPMQADPRFHDLARRVGFPPDTLRRAGIPIEAPPASKPASAGVARQHPN